jgi:hypothetical protein
MKTIKVLVSIFIFSVILAACSKFNNESEYLNNSAKIKFLLTDSPVNYQEVNIDVRSVQVIIDDSLINLDAYSGVYNLLDFVNGKDTIVVDDIIPTGKLSQVRLILGDNNSFMVDSVLYDLKVPSGSESGLKLIVNKEIISGETYTYIIDFDAAKSIIKTGNGEYGKYILKPVLHVFPEIGANFTFAVISYGWARLVLI